MCSTHASLVYGRMATYAIDYELVDRKGEALRIVRMPYDRMASVGTVLSECTIPSCRRYARSMVYGRMATYAIDYELVDRKGKALRIVRTPYDRMASVGTVLSECTIPSCRQYARSMDFGRMATYAIDYELWIARGRHSVSYARRMVVWRAYDTVLSECTIPSCRQYARSMAMVAWQRMPSTTSSSIARGRHSVSYARRMVVWRAYVRSLTNARSLRARMHVCTVDPCTYALVGKVVRSPS